MTTATASAGAPAPATAVEAGRYQQLRSHLTTLKLLDAAEALPVVLDQARTEKLTLTAALERLLRVEVTATQARRLAGRLRFACLPTGATLEEFDYDAQPGVDPRLVADLASCRYLESATNVLMIGPPGVGKTMLATGLARKAVEAGYRTYFTTAADLAARCHRAAIEGRWGHHHAVLRRPHPPGDRRTGLFAVAGRGRVRVVSGRGPAVPQDLDHPHDK